MKNLQRGYVIPLIIAVIAVLAIGGGIYYSKNRTESSTTNNISGSNPDIQIQSALNETSEWQTYTSTRFGFSFKYPPNWYVNDNLGVNSLSVGNYSYPPSNDRTPEDFIGIQFQYHTKTASESLRDIASRPSELGGFVPKVESVTIAGFNAIKSNEIGDGVYYLPKSQTEYMIVLGPLRGLNKSAGKIIDRILSTFKFTK